MTISIFNIFKIGIGPSSSHTVGPMKAAKEFLMQLETQQSFAQVAKVQVDLYGSLALTGKGHGTDKAIIMGLLGESPEHVDPTIIETILGQLYQQREISLLSKKRIAFNETDLRFHLDETLPKHTNGMRFTALNEAGAILHQVVYYSIGGGFIVTETDFDHPISDEKTVPYPFSTARELLTLCQDHNLSISELMLANEKTWHNEAFIAKELLAIADVMKAAIEKGCVTPGILPGGLQVIRRAPELHQLLSEQGKPNHRHPDVMNWLNLFAMAVNEENAAGGRVVTAPTNGAAGVIPAILQYYRDFVATASTQGIIDFLLTAGAIAILYKCRASISGAEVGCQGEVGVACSMAAAALVAVLGGTLWQIENAAEIAMEHNLGLPCDPPAGLVQIPCIERNAMASVKALNASYLALTSKDKNYKVSLDAVIKTMYQMGLDMKSIYKETSLGGLAVNITEC